MPVKIDIIILSFAKTNDLKNITLNGLETLLASEPPEEIEFNVLVIESNKGLNPYQYPGTTTIYPDTGFGFNKYLNIGISATHNKYICLCNNDLVFHHNWAKKLLNFIDTRHFESIVLSPFCETSHINFASHKDPIEGYFGYFAGHCFFTTRKTLKAIGKLDEKINFWYADMDFINMMKKNNVPHYLVPESKVVHLVSRSTVLFSKLDALKYTYYPRIYFIYKWEGKNLFTYIKNLTKFSIKYILYHIEGIFKKNLINDRRKN